MVTIHSTVIGLIACLSLISASPIRNEIDSNSIESAEQLKNDLGLIIPTHNLKYSDDNQGSESPHASTSNIKHEYGDYEEKELEAEQDIFGNTIPTNRVASNRIPAYSSSSSDSAFDFLEYLNSLEEQNDDEITSSSVMKSINPYSFNYSPSERINILISDSDSSDDDNYDIDEEYEQELDNDRLHIGTELRRMKSEFNRLASTTNLMQDNRIRNMVTYRRRYNSGRPGQLPTIYEE